MNKEAGTTSSCKAGALLAIETTGPVCSAALMTAEGRLLHRASEEGLMHLTSLLPMVDELLKEADLRPRHLGRIAVSAGPGSFTGIRIGVATARALSQTLSIPIVKVPTLEAFVYITEEKHSFSDEQHTLTDEKRHTFSDEKRHTFSDEKRRTFTEEKRRTFTDERRRPFIVSCPIFDARRDQIYSGAYMLEADGRIMTLVNGGAYAPEDYFGALSRSMTALARLAKNVKPVCRFMGDGLPFFREPVEYFIANSSALGIETILDPAVQDARAVLEWAIEQGSTDDQQKGDVPCVLQPKGDGPCVSQPKGDVPCVSYEDIEPIYYRKAEAQRRLEEREAATIQGDVTKGDVPCVLLSPTLRTQGTSPFVCSSPLSWIVRPADEKDVYGISVVERLSFGEPWLEESILSDLKLEYSDYVVCESEGHIIGYAGLHRILDEGHITNIAVHPARRMQGVGSSALEELINRSEAKGIVTFTLEVRYSDAAATRFYENQGFVSEGVRKDYYPVNGGGREDALIMWRRPGKDGL